ELGTAAAWTTSALALAEPGRRVLSWDVEVHPQREATLALLPPDVRARVELHARPGGTGPHPPPPLDALFLDSSHEREETAESFRLFAAALPPGGVVAFHDFADPDYPGVMEAIDELGLTGRAAGHVFVWRKP
nr:class I SAM-dependent methyltransferase [Solirubrobacterales bacterium]